jgi:eukaryotic-like serine/threonine-protein kinase
MRCVNCEAMKTKISSNTLLGMFTHTGVVVVLLVSLFLGFVRLYLPRYTHQGEEVVVPDVRQFSLEQAIKILEVHRLRYEVVDSMWSPLRKPLTVVGQYPRGGGKVKVNRKVELWLNPKVRPTVRVQKQ